MKLIDIIQTRRSIFPIQFTSQNVSKEQLMQMLEAANWAPSHRKTNPWRFKVFKDESLNLLAEKVESAYKRTTPEKVFSEFKLKKSLEKILTSGAVIAICMQRDPKESLPEWEEIAATAMAVQNMWLMAGQLGLAGYWSSPGYIEDMQDELELADGERCLGFFYLGGYDREMSEAVREPVEDKITWF